MSSKVYEIFVKFLLQITKRKLYFFADKISIYRAQISLTQLFHSKVIVQFKPSCFVKDEKNARKNPFHLAIDCFDLAGNKNDISFGSQIMMTVQKSVRFFQSH